MMRLLVSKPLVSAFAAAFLRSVRRCSADLTGQRARETPNCLPVVALHQQCSESNIFQHPSWRIALHTVSPVRRGFRSRTLCSTTCSTSIAPHRYSLLVLEDIVEVSDGTSEFPPVDGLGGFASVFEGDTEVGTARASGLRGLNCGGCVTDLKRADGQFEWFVGARIAAVDRYGRCRLGMHSWYGGRGTYHLALL